MAKVKCKKRKKGRKEEKERKRRKTKEGKEGKESEKNGFKAKEKAKAKEKQIPKGREAPKGGQEDKEEGKEGWQKETQEDTPPHNVNVTRKETATPGGSSPGVACHQTQDCRGWKNRKKEQKKLKSKKQHQRQENEPQNRRKNLKMENGEKKTLKRKKLKKKERKKFLKFLCSGWKLDGGSAQSGCLLQKMKEKTKNKTSYAVPSDLTKEEKEDEAVQKLDQSTRPGAAGCCYLERW